MAIDNLTQTETAERLGVSTSWLRVLTDRGTVTRSEDDTYPWPRVREEYDAYQRTLEEEREPEPSQAMYEEARARREMARARLAELAMLEATGEMVRFEDAVSSYGRRLDLLRAGLQNLPGRWGAQITGIETASEGEAMLERVATELLDELDSGVRHG